MRHDGRVPVELADGFADRLLEYCDAARVVLLAGLTEGGLAGGTLDCTQADAGLS